MRQIAIYAAEHYALQSIDLKQLCEVCESKEEFCDALLYADAYLAEYNAWCDKQNQAEDARICKVCGELLWHDNERTVVRINNCKYELTHKKYVTFIATAASRYKTAQIFKDLKVAVNGSYYVSYPIEVIESKNGIAVILC